MYNFTRLSHIVDEFILPAGMRVWVVCTHTRTRLPDGYMMMPICIHTGRNIIPYSSPYRVKHVGYSGFGYSFPSLLVPKTVIFYPELRNSGNRLVGELFVSALFRVFRSTLQIGCRPLTVV
jgi:hypothetical protein